MLALNFGVKSKQVIQVSPSKNVGLDQRSIRHSPSNSSFLCRRERNRRGKDVAFRVKLDNLVVLCFSRANQGFDSTFDIMLCLHDHITHSTGEAEVDSLVSTWREAFQADPQFRLE